MVKSSNLSWIVVSDIKKARDFFSKSIGLKEKVFSEEHGWAEFEGEAEGGAVLGVALENSELMAGKNAVITFTVENLEASIKKFREKGVRLIGDVLEVPGHCKMQTFQDDDGNLFQIVELLEVYNQ